MTLQLSKRAMEGSYKQALEGAAHITRSNILMQQFSIMMVDPK